MFNKTKLLLCMIAFVFSSQLYAFEKWYKVELIILEHKDKSGVTLEEWPIDPGYPKVRNSYLLQSTQEDGTLPTNFIELPKKAMGLTEAKNSMVNRTGNKVLLHKAWRQKVKENQPEPIRFKSTKTYQYQPEGEKPYSLLEFDGTLTILLSRYLHVDSDLVFHRPMQVLEQSSSYEHSTMQKLKPLASHKDWQNQKDTQLQRFRFKEKRKVKKNEVLYIDHPMYGIMLQITDDKSHT